MDGQFWDELYDLLLALLHEWTFWPGLVRVV